MNQELKSPLIFFLSILDCIFTNNTSLIYSCIDIIFHSIKLLFKKVQLYFKYSKRFKHWQTIFPGLNIEK